jgi:hypothetical protein
VGDVGVHGIIRPVRRLPLLVALGALIVAIGFSALGWGGAGGSRGQPAASSVAAASTPSRTAPGSPVGPSSSTAVPSAPVPSSAPASPPASGAIGDVAIVPVAQYRTTVESIGRDDIRAVLAGTHATWNRLELVADEADAIFAGLGIARPSADAGLVLAPDVATVARDLAKSRKRLAVLRADAVGPSVRALGWGGRSLFGTRAVESIADWRLTARLPQLADGPAFDPATSWTLFAAGDVMLDRGVAQTLKIKGKGADFPFDGGTAEITSICKDCSPLGWDTPGTRRTGNDGVVRKLVEGADLAIANFENPAPDRFRYHTTGTSFSADPSLIAGLAKAGMDWVGLANNHIGDAGQAGILQTIANLKRHGIAASGAGKDLKAARKPAILEANGTKVAFLAYDTIAAYYAAGSAKAGSARLTRSTVRADIAAARKAGADVVIVFPHWGTEYDATPFTGQQLLARAAIDAGADMVIGNHAHWAGAMEVHDGKPIWYALGNFIFDQTWSIPTMEGITLELTFRGPTLVQAWMRPHIILDKAQPNLLDPRGDGRAVMRQVFDASGKLLPW